MTDTISSLNDATAKQVLDAFVRARMATEKLVTDLTPDMFHTLRERFSVDPSTDAPSEGDLARVALLILVKDPEAKKHITMLAKTGPTRGYDFETGLSMTTAALLVLQNHIRFKRAKDGKSTQLVEREPADPELLRSLVHKILSRIASGADL
ncbi:MAG: hypothetical protein PVI86_08280 [Phycisphaerae bacterium]|jgi:hypothetical protein